MTRHRSLRRYLYVVLVAGVFGILFSFYYLVVYDNETLRNGDSSSSSKFCDVSRITCNINEESRIKCLKSDGDAFVPFSFVRQYFDIYGKLSPDGNTLNWHHSYSKVNRPPKTPYETRGPFLWFANYNVAVRERVKCISAKEGVPISTQWSAGGHFYPTQIAQFGLSHFSKNISALSAASNRFERLLDNGSDVTWSLVQWRVSDSAGAKFKRVNDDAAGDALEFKTSGKADDLGVEFAFSKLWWGGKKNPPGHSCLTMHLRVMRNASVSVHLVDRASAENENEEEVAHEYKIHYLATEIPTVLADGSDLYYSMGTTHEWRELNRDLTVDLQKGFKPKHKRKLIIKAVVFRGWGRVANISIQSDCHWQHFLAASDYLVRHQDGEGGWPISVRRQLSGGALVLEAGWYSAMAQGQAMSLLVRAFLHTAQPPYLEAALKATRPFAKVSAQGGVTTTFAGKYVWYEEYPTTPSSFVLNGFIYALIGLYDLTNVCDSTPECRNALKLYRDGLVSLKKMLPLFDTGSGTVYDLRHYSLGTTAPNLARWDYHTTHINQILFLDSIEPDPIFEKTAARWIDYMRGKRAPHN